MGIYKYDFICYNYLVNNFGEIMGKRKIEEIIKKGSENNSNSFSTFEVELAKILTACVIMPSINVEFEFEKSEKNQLKLILYPTKQSDTKFKKTIIDFSMPMAKTYQLCIASNKIYTHMLQENILTNKDCMFKNDDILWTALDNATNSVKFNPDTKEELENRITNTSLRINTFRKLLNAKIGIQMSEYESLITTILACLDYFTNSNDEQNSFSRMSVNASTYFKQINDLECINRAIRMNCVEERDVSYNDYLCARNSLEDKKASYLAGLHGTDFSKSDCYNMSKIVISKADILNPEMKFED